MNFKAHVLERLGRRSECISLCNEVKLRKSYEEAVLSCLTLNYKLMGMIDDVIECYEYALESSPKNEDLSRELFFSYVRKVSLGLILNIKTVNE